MWNLKWFFRCPDRLKAFAHTRHSYGFSPLWTLACLLRSPESLKALPHNWHSYGFSPLWILLCTISWPEVVNRLQHTLHSNGFSPEWLRLCLAKSLVLRQHLPHSLQLYLFVWIFICCRRLTEHRKFFTQRVHENTFPPACLSLWRVMSFFVVNRLSHTVHWYGLGLSSRWCSVMTLLSASNVINSSDSSASIFTVVSISVKLFPEQAQETSDTVSFMMENKTKQCSSIEQSRIYIAQYHECVSSALNATVSHRCITNSPISRLNFKLNFVSDKTLSVNGQL